MPYRNLSQFQGFDNWETRCYLTIKVALLFALTVVRGGGLFEMLCGL